MKIENLIVEEAQQFNNSLNYPELSEFLTKLENTKQRSRRFFLYRLCVVILICLLLLAGCGAVVHNLYFRDIDRFKNLKASAKISEINVTQSIEEIRLTLHSTFYDGKDLYLLISSQGYDLNQVNSSALDPSEKNLLNSIQLAKVTGTKNIEYYFRPNVIEKNGNGASFTYNNPNLYGIHLNSDEALICIEDISYDDIYSLDILLVGMQKHFKFNDLTIENNKRYVRDVSKMNLTFEVSNAKGKIQKITYTDFKTILTVQWTFTENFEFWDELAMHYIRNYKIYINDGSDDPNFETSLLLLPVDDGTNEKSPDSSKDWKDSNREVTRTSNYEMDIAYSPEQTIQLAEYKQKISEPRGNINRILCTIEPDGEK